MKKKFCFVKVHGSYVSDQTGVGMGLRALVHNRYIASYIVHRPIHLTGPNKRNFDSGSPNRNVASKVKIYLTSRTTNR